MKLDSKDKKILSVLQFEAGLSVTEAVRQAKPDLNFNSHTVRRVLQRRIQSGIVTIVPLVNFGLLERSYCRVFGKVRSLGEIPEKTLKRVLALPGVLRLSRLAGDVDIEIELLSHSIMDLQLQLDAISRSGVQLAKRSIAHHTSSVFYNRSYLDQRVARQYREICFDRGTTSFDETDLDIVGAVLNQESACPSSIARELALPRTTVSRRISRLQEVGVLPSIRYELNPLQCGIDCYELLLSLTQTGNGASERVRKLCDQCHNVTRLDRLLGEFDYRIRLETHTPEELLSFKQLLQTQLSNELSSLSISSQLSLATTRRNPFESPQESFQKAA